MHPDVHVSGEEMNQFNIKFSIGKFGKHIYL